MAKCDGCGATMFLGQKKPQGLFCEELCYKKWQRSNSISHAISGSLKKAVDQALAGREAEFVVETALGNALAGTGSSLLAITTGTFGGQKSEFLYSDLTSLSLGPSVSGKKVITIVGKTLDNQRKKIDIPMHADMESSGFAQIYKIVGQKCSSASGQTAVTKTSSLPPSVDVAEELRKFAALKDDGIITPEEFETKKIKLLEQPSTVGSVQTDVNAQLWPQTVITTPTSSAQSATSGFIRFLAIACALLFIPNLFSSSGVSKPKDYKVKYRVTGSASPASLTIRNASGGIDQMKVSIPWETEFTAQPRTSRSLYLAAQKQDEYNGSLKTEILVNGEVVQSGETNASYGIASCAGSI